MTSRLNKRRLCLVLAMTVLLAGAAVHPAWASPTKAPPPGELVPAAVLVAGPPTAFHALLVDKKLQQMHVFLYQGSRPPQQERSLAVSTGRIQGDKVREGDRRTPEGIYFFTRAFTDNRTTIFGRRAYHLNYPDPFDRLDGRRGNGIYLHGTNRPLGSRDTNGCVVMDNADLDWLSDLVRLNTTPIIIAGSLEWITPAEYERRSAAAGQAIDRLLASAPIREGAGGQERLLPPSWTVDAPDGAPAAGQGILFIQNRRRIVRVPVVRDSGVAAWRTAYLAVSGNDPALLAVVHHPTGLDKLSSKRRLSPEGREGILDFLQDWVAAWESRQIDPYMSFYASGFRAYGMDRRAWRKYKTGLARKYRAIDVRIDNISVAITGGRARAVFDQAYVSDAHRDFGRKTLTLAREDGRWRIIREHWTPVRTGKRTN